MGRPKTGRTRRGLNLYLHPRLVEEARRHAEQVYGVTLSELAARLMRRELRTRRRLAGSITAVSPMPYERGPAQTNKHKE